MLFTALFINYDIDIRQDCRSGQSDGMVRPQNTCFCTVEGVVCLNELSQSCVRAVEDLMLVQTSCKTVNCCCALFRMREGKVSAQKSSSSSSSPLRSSRVQVDCTSSSASSGGPT